MNDDKRALRQAFNALFRRQTQAEVDLASQAVCTRVLALPQMSTISVLAAFVAMPLELDPAGVIDALLARQNPVFLPRFNAELKAYEMAAIRSRLDLIPGKMKIPEPRRELPSMALGQGDSSLWLIPGLAFDRAGNRLGRGAGYYDRMLATTRGLKIGIARDWQIVDAVPTEAHDVRMDMVITPDHAWMV